MEFLRGNKGAVAAEYALILSLVAVVVTTGLNNLGSKINLKLNATATAMTPAA